MYILHIWTIVCLLTILILGVKKVATVTTLPYVTETSSEEGACKGNGGENCIFPFTYDGISYKECTWTESIWYNNDAWCAIEADETTHEVMKFDNCGPDCHVAPITSQDTNILIKKILNQGLRCNLTLSQDETAEEQEQKIIGVCGRSNTANKEIWKNATNICSEEINGSKGGGFRTLCEDKKWLALRGNEIVSISEDFLDLKHCNGHRPSQQIRDTFFCDDKLDCIDRSDETNCGKLKRSSLELRQPKLTSSQRETITTWALMPDGESPKSTQCDPIMYKLARPDECPYEDGSWDENCNNTVTQISINNTCFPYTFYLCTVEFHLEYPAFYGHPDQTSFCQNFTFWKNKTERPNSYEGDELYPCFGNYPGYVSRRTRTECQNDTNDNPTWVCPDRSDAKICPASDCDTREYFACADNSYCIYNGLICDGYRQCPDGSDEANCGKCPPTEGPGFPLRPESERYLNNFPCLHRYTLSPICAIRCDGRDDLCTGYADEVGCRRAAIQTIAFYTIAALVALVLILLCLDIMIPSWGNLVPRQILGAGTEMKTVSLHVEQRIGESDVRNYEEYAELRSSDDFITALRNAIFEAENRDPETLQQTCRFYYELELWHNSHSGAFNSDGEVRGVEAVQVRETKDQTEYNESREIPDQEEDNDSQICSNKQDIEVGTTPSENDQKQESLGDTDNFVFAKRDNGQEEAEVCSSSKACQVDKDSAVDVEAFEDHKQDMEGSSKGKPDHDRSSLAVQATDAFFFDTLGTNDVSFTFYSNAENGLLVRFNNWYCRKFPNAWKTVNATSCKRISYALLLFSSIFAYYLDYVKDAFLVSETAIFVRGERVDILLTLLFSVSASSLLLPILPNVVTVMKFKRWSKVQKLFAGILIIFVPAVIKYRVYRMKLKYQKELQEDGGPRLNELLELSANIEALVGLSVELRANENCTEHFIQLMLPMLLIFIRNSSTATVPPYISEFLVDLSGFFLVATTAWSFLSLARGQLNLMIHTKGHYIPFVGKLILIAYYTTTTFARVFAMVLLVTPSLGLFDTLHHYNHGSKVAYVDKLDGPDNAVFDIGANDTVIWFHELWNAEYKFDSRQQFCDALPMSISLLVLVVVLHPLIGRLLQRKIYYKGTEPANATWITTILDGLHTMISPALHMDWEFIYRLNGGTVSVTECWKRSKSFLMASQALLLFENLAMLTPLLALRSAIGKRNAHLAPNFPLLEDERYSTDVVNYLLISGFLGLPLISAASLFLAYIYYVRWHAWSRILWTKM